MQAFAIMLKLFEIYAVLALIFSVTTGQSVCTGQDMKQCLASLNSVYTSDNTFWFGTQQYKTACPRGFVGDFPCLNSRPSRTSILKRMMGDGATSVAAFVVNVTYHRYEITPAEVNDTHADHWCQRSYKGCGHIVTTPLNSANYFEIDPSSSATHAPFDLRYLPYVEWPAKAGSLSTVAMYDSSLFYGHALYINVPGNTFGGNAGVTGTMILEHRGPGNPVDRSSPYIWMVLRQAGRFDPQMFQQFFKARLAESNGQFFFDTMTKAYSFTEYGLNVVRTRTDEYAAIKVRDFGALNPCPTYYAKYIDNEIKRHGKGNLPYLNTHNLSLSVDLHYTAPPLDFQMCCKKYHENSVNLTIDYHDTDMHGSFETRIAPDVKFVQENLSARGTFGGRTFTLVLFDPTDDLSATTYNNSRIHWMVTNIHSDRVSSGSTVFSYLSPMPMAPMRLYLVALFEQQGHVQSSKVAGYGDSGCPGKLKYRCGYRMGDFISSNSLTLVGLKHLRVAADQYAKRLAYDMGMMTMEQLCT